MLSEIQSELKAAKSQFNSFGDYSYRSCEDIVEAVKPLLHDKGLYLLMSDEMELLGDWHYVTATVSIFKDDGTVVATTKASARETLDKKKMDSSQLTGAASSYARKYALSGLLAIDDNKDADSMKPEDKGSAKPSNPKSEEKEHEWSSSSDNNHIGLLKTFKTKAEFQLWRKEVGDKLSPNIKSEIMTEYFKLIKEVV
jgi:hypothetical protein